jgi:hypothetical protein
MGKGLPDSAAGHFGEQLALPKKNKSPIPCDGSGDCSKSYPTIPCGICRKYLSYSDCIILQKEGQEL